MFSYPCHFKLAKFMKQATTIEEQIQLLKSRGVIISDENKAKEVLMDIGYYRLGFYLFPFEKAYPKLKKRSHEYKEGTTLQGAVTLYYYDFDLRNILLRYINRIEVAFRTYMIYDLSNKYKSEPIGINQTAVFENYMEAIRIVRNKCAHGSTMFDLSLNQSIKNGPAGKFNGSAHSLSAAISVIFYMIGTISKNRQNDLRKGLLEISDLAINRNPEIAWVIKK